jgi:hypothetical protein
LQKRQWLEEWRAEVSRSSLSAVHEHLHPSGDAQTKLDKTLQRFFLDESIEAIREQFQASAMSPCP